MARTDGGDAEARDVESVPVPGTAGAPGPGPGRTRTAVRPVMEYATIWFAAACTMK